jgi:hypothetical protein
MKHITFGKAFIRLFTLIALSFALFGFTNNLGLDKLILKQAVNQPLNLRVLKLHKANSDDQLHIKYRHCTIKDGAGTNRNIILKDEKGNTVKKWVFADATGSDLSMAIAVKELLQLEKNNARHELSLHYTARELPKGEMLAMVRVE